MNNNEIEVLCHKMLDCLDIDIVDRRTDLRQLCFESKKNRSKLIHFARPDDVIMPNPTSYLQLFAQLCTCTVVVNHIIAFDSESGYIKKETTANPFYKKSISEIQILLDLYEK